MTSRVEELDPLACRRALEALRSGVPNAEAVNILGCNQPRVERRFADLMSGAATAGGRSHGDSGMLIRGDFGAGKSHLLTWLEQRALSCGFVCSKVAISKETPFYDLGRVFKSAMDSGRVPGRSGRLIEEIGQALDPESEKYGGFRRWADDTRSNRLNRMFPASLLVHQRSNDPELNNEIENFWAGDKLLSSKIKGGLRRIGQLPQYQFRAPKAAELPPQRLRFAVELIRAAGYRGWVVLIDEIELVGSYSLLQRGRSYAELVRWLGRAAGESHPGLVTVGTVTEDFAATIISPGGEKKDRSTMRNRLEKSDRYRHLADLAVTGMNLLETGGISLAPPADADVRETIGKLRAIHSAAYGWEAPALPEEARGAGYRNRMRYKVRASIGQWDLLRHYPGSRPDIEGDEFQVSYAENPDLERPSGNDAG